MQSAKWEVVYQDDLQKVLRFGNNWHIRYNLDNGETQWMWLESGYGRHQRFLERSDRIGLAYDRLWLKPKGK